MHSFRGLLIETSTGCTACGIKISKDLVLLVFYKTTETNHKGIRSFLWYWSQIKRDIFEEKVLMYRTYSTKYASSNYSAALRLSLRLCAKTRSPFCWRYYILHRSCGAGFHFWYYLILCWFSTDLEDIITKNYNSPTAPFNLHQSSRFKGIAGSTSEKPHTPPAFMPQDRMQIRYRSF